MTAGLRATTVRLEEPPDPLSVLPDQRGLAWLTSDTSLIAAGPWLRFDPGTGPQRFVRGVAEVQRLLDGARVEDPVDQPGTGPVVFGSWTFDDASAGSWLALPTTIWGYGEEAAWRTDIDFGDRIPDLRHPHIPRAGDALDDVAWERAVGSALTDISAGRLEKVVLARKVQVDRDRPIERRRLLQWLRSRYPGCFTFCFNDLVGASPELLIRRLGDLVDSVPLAGSTGRGADEEEDLRLGRALQESGKNRAEHELAVQTVMTKLEPWCADLVREPEPSLLLLANLQHLSTKIQGRLNEPADSLTLAGALHPTAAVCGVPQDQATAAIRRLEGFDRGRYAGPVGWQDHRGDGEWALALRCALIDGARAEVFAGAGIVAGSDPRSELEETRLKLDAMLSALEQTR